MRLKLLSNRALAELRSDCHEKQNLYLSGRASSILSAMNPSNCILESRIEVDNPPVLTMPGEFKDAENVRKVFQWLHCLSPIQASDPRLWVYLTHSIYSEYAASRWPISEESKVLERIKERYFYEGEGSATIVRNAVSRLWWFGYLTHDTNRPNPFELTDVLLSLQDMQVAFLERAIGRSPRILRQVLELWRKLTQERAVIPKQGDVIKKWAKLIRLYGGVVLLDALPDQQLQNVLWLKLGEALNEKFPDLEEAV